MVAGIFTSTQSVASVLLRRARDLVGYVANFAFRGFAHGVNIAGFGLRLLGLRFRLLGRFGHALQGVPVVEVVLLLGVFCVT